VSRLNATAAVVMDACAKGNAGEAVTALAELHPGRARAALERDALGTARRLARRGVLNPSLAVSTSSVSASVPRSIPSSEPLGSPP
jgi:hypothetical protein